MISKPFLRDFIVIAHPPIQLDQQKIPNNLQIIEVSKAWLNFFWLIYDSSSNVFRCLSDLRQKFLITGLSRID